MSAQHREPNTGASTFIDRTRTSQTLERQPAAQAIYAVPHILRCYIEAYGAHITCIGYAVQGRSQPSRLLSSHRLLGANFGGCADSIVTARSHRVLSVGVS